MIANQASAWHFWVVLSTNFLFRRLAKEGRKIGELERKMLEDHSTPHGKRYFVNLSWVIPCCEQKLGIGAQAMCIACNDTSVIVINFPKSKTHAITDTYCIPDWRGSEKKLCPYHCWGNWMRIVVVCETHGQHLFGKMIYSRGVFFADLMT